MKIVFFGTSSFSVTVLQHLLESSQNPPMNVIAIVTQQDQPQGRSQRPVPSAVKQWAMTHAPHIQLYQPLKVSSEPFIALMHSLLPDLFIVASYGQLMSKSLLQVPRMAPINVHASLLPRWRGAAPIQRSLMAGESQTGVTIMKMVLQLDAGDMLDRIPVAVPLEMTHGELEHALAVASRDPLLKVLKEFQQGTVQAIAQDPLLVTVAPKIVAAETEIHWRQSALQIHNQIRALSPDPGAWTWVRIGEKRKKLKIKRSRYVPNPSTTPMQTTLLNAREWVIGCAKDDLSLLEVQLEGKNILPISDFLRGLHSLPKILMG